MGDSLAVPKTMLTAVADSIRAKTGKNGLLKVSEMPGEIESITTGGGKQLLIRRWSE